MDYLSQINLGKKLVCNYKYAQEDNMGNYWMEETWYKNNSKYICEYEGHDFTTTFDFEYFDLMFKYIIEMQANGEVDIKIVNEKTTSHKNIENIINNLKILWQKHDYLTFGKILTVIESKTGCIDHFFVDDETFNKYILECIEQLPDIDLER